MPPGFVQPSDGTPVVNGIDISKYQTDPIFAGVRKCGGSFVYVRLSAGTDENNELAYRPFWGNARSMDFIVGPYHHLTLVGVGNPLHLLGKADLAALIDKNRDHGAAQAALFKKRLTEVLSYDPISAQASGTFGAPYLPAVLDLTETPQAKFSQADRDAVAPIYGAAVCGFIATFQSDARFREQPVILFTKPFIFHDYLLAKAPCDLGKAKVWVSYHGRTGDRPLTDPDPGLRQAAQELCVSGGENRCVFEQYTSYGGFAVFATGAGLDLDRYIGTLDGMQSLLQRAHPEAAR